MKRIELDSLIIRGGRVIDPAAGRDEVADVTIVDGRITDERPLGAAGLDASGWLVCPGLLDIHVHLREPGQTHKETIATGTAAAAAGGFTFVACMPNTRPPLDDPDLVRRVCRLAREAGSCVVGPIAAITRGRAGRKVTDFGALIEAGAVAFSDDGDGVEDDEVMLAAFQQARDHETVLIQHCEYKSISAGGVMHLGSVSEGLGLPGLDPRSEEAMIERDLALAGKTGARYHVAHVSTGVAVDLIRRAKADGVRVTAEVCPHHLLLTHQACRGADPNTKIHPPLRLEEDVQACRQGLMDGTIDCIATDHAPHTREEKAAGFLTAPPGMVGLETAIPLAVQAMIDTGLADWPRLIEWFTTKPAAVLGLDRPPMTPGSVADLTILDPRANWRINTENFLSKSRNTPFHGRQVTGRAIGTVRGRQAMVVEEVTLQPVSE